MVLFEWIWNGTSIEKETHLLKKDWMTCANSPDRNRKSVSYDRELSFRIGPREETSERYYL